jgi:RsiW-degrading membrane proteinase PrsW (M82 family)
MTDKIFLFLIAILPTLTLLLFFMYSDKFREPKKTILSTFILGIFIIAPLEVFHYGTIMILGEPIEYNAFFRAFFKAAFLEELFKFCVLFFFCTKFSDFNEPMDGIVYGITASLGFAFWENLEYVYLYDDLTTKESLQMVWRRSFTAVPSHAFDGVIMGFFIGRHYFRDYKTKINLVWALLIPITLHGFYDWVLMEESINGNFMYLIMIVELGLVAYLYRNLKTQQIFKKKEMEINTRR